MVRGSALTLMATAPLGAMAMRERRDPLRVRLGEPRDAGDEGGHLEGLRQASVGLHLRGALTGAGGRGHHHDWARAKALGRAMTRAQAFDEVLAG